MILLNGNIYLFLVSCNFILMKGCPIYFQTCNNTSTGTYETRTNKRH